MYKYTRYNKILTNTFYRIEDVLNDHSINKFNQTLHA